jgi:hypothetical protein
VTIDDIPTGTTATSGNDGATAAVIRGQLRHFSDDDARCRALQLPEGIMLRYTMSSSMYFYLLTAVSDGKITTRVFASNSPYEPRKASIGQVSTPMFETQADVSHLAKVKRLVHSWIQFTDGGADAGPEFRSFEMEQRRE